MLEIKPRSPIFSELFKPGYIGKLRLKNRVIFAAMKTLSADMKGCVTNRVVMHYREMARGGAGLIIVDGAYIDNKASKMVRCQLGISDDEHVPGLKWLADTIKANGAKSCLQLNHAGLQKSIGNSLKAPSRIPINDGGPIPDELLIEEIMEIVESFGNAAARAKQAGFDMIEVLAGHGYLITNFLSSRTNKRNDCYGGSLNNRMRFLLQIVKCIRKRVGYDYPICIRLSGTDYEEIDPITIEETMELSKALENTGVDIIHVSGGGSRKIHKEVAPMYLPQANNLWAAEAIKKIVNIPIVASGSINTPELAEGILKEKKADFIALGRPIFADPYFPQKAQEGRPEDIRCCIRCLDGCFLRGYMIGGLSCSINPTLGNQDELKLIPADKIKKVAIIGGGPAGMEAAIIAFLRGHEVSLFEKRELGGILIEATFPSFKADIKRLISYLRTQIEKLKIKIIFAEATTQTIKDGGFEVAVVATGATLRMPEVKGKDKSSVVSCLDVLRGTDTGEGVIVIGGGMIGGDVALFLAEQGKKVIITTRGDNIVSDMDPISYLGYFERLSKCHIEIRTGVNLAEITNQGVILYNKLKEKVAIHVDSVVLAGGLVSNRFLFDGLCEQIPEVEIYGIGDCVEPRKIFDAIHEGYEVAFKI